MAQNKRKIMRSRRQRQDSERGKISAMRRQIFRELVMITSALALAALLMYVIGNWEAERDAERKKLDGEVNGIGKQVNDLQSKLTRVEKALPIFDKLFPNKAAPEIQLDRRLAAEQIEKLKEDYFFSALRISMSPPRDLEEGALKNRFVASTAVDIQISAEALSDEHVLKFVEKLRGVLPGYLQMQSISFTKQTEPTSQMMALITQSGKVGLVKSEVRLSWLGIKPLNAPPAPVPAPPGTPEPKPKGEK